MATQKELVLHCSFQASKLALASNLRMYDPVDCAVPGNKYENFDAG
jgi:hypothetical protein